jgi:predicted permease
MDISGIFRQMFILFAVVGIGFAAGKLGQIDAEFNKRLSALVINITNPAMILASAMEERVLTRAELLQLTGIAVLSYLALILVALVVPGLIRSPKEDAGVYRFMIIFSNVGFMGFPVVNALFGPEAVFFASVFTIPFNILAYTYGIYLISGERPEKGKKLLTHLSPSLVAAVIAYIIYILNISVPQVVSGTMSFVGQITSPAAMLIIGASLASVPFRKVFGEPRMYAISVIKLIILPIITWYLVGLVVKNDVLLGVIVIMLGMPVATNCTMLAAQYGKRVDTASSGVFITTLLSIVTIPLLMWILF